MTIGIVKTVDKAIYKYENPERFEADRELNILNVISNYGDKIYFPLVNVIAFSIEEVRNDK